MTMPDKLISLASTMIRMPSFTGSEHAISAWMHDWCHAAGFDRVHRLPVPEAADTTLAALDNGAGPSMLFYFHVDIFSTPAGWTRDPFDPGSTASACMA